MSATGQPSKYHTREYRHAYAALVKAQKAGEWLWCMQSECVMPTRWIPPWAPVDLGHDDAGIELIGATHRFCNRRDGGKRKGKNSRPRRCWTL
jgi:hypothetical protein